MLFVLFTLTQSIDNCPTNTDVSIIIKPILTGLKKIDLKDNFSLFGKESIKVLEPAPFKEMKDKIYGLVIGNLFPAIIMGILFAVAFIYTLVYMSLCCCVCKPKYEGSAGTCFLTTWIIVSVFFVISIVYLIYCLYYIFMFTYNFQDIPSYIQSGISQTEDSFYKYFSISSSSISNTALKSKIGASIFLEGINQISDVFQLASTSLSSSDIKAKLELANKDCKTSFKFDPGKTEEEFLLQYESIKKSLPSYSSVSSNLEAFNSIKPIYLPFDKYTDITSMLDSYSFVDVESVKSDFDMDKPYFEMVPYLMIVFSLLIILFYVLSTISCISKPSNFTRCWAAAHPAVSFVSVLILGALGFFLTDFAVGGNDVCNDSDKWVTKFYNMKTPVTSGTYSPVSTALFTNKSGNLYSGVERSKEYINFATTKSNWESKAVTAISASSAPNVASLKDAISNSTSFNNDARKLIKLAYSLKSKLEEVDSKSTNLDAAKTAIVKYIDQLNALAYNHYVDIQIPLFISAAESFTKGNSDSAEIVKYTVSNALSELEENVDKNLPNSGIHCAYSQVKQEFCHFTVGGFSAYSIFAHIYMIVTMIFVGMLSCRRINMGDEDKNYDDNQVKVQRPTNRGPVWSGSSVNFGMEMSDDSSDSSSSIGPYRERHSGVL